MASLAYFNGRFIPENELKLSFADAGFVYGATVTDFCRTYNHTLFRWPDHLARLRRDAEVCHIPLLPTDAEITTAAEQLVAARSLDLEPGDDLVLITFATPGPLGYMTGTAENGPPTLGMHCFPIPKERYRRFFTEGVDLEIAGFHSSGGQFPIVPLHVKHRSRLAWWLAGRAVAGGRVAVLCDQYGGSVDTAIGAVLAVAGDTVLCSEAERILDSVSLKVVEELCGRIGLKFVRSMLVFGTLAKPLEAADRGTILERITEVALAGSAFGVAGVKGFHGPSTGREFPCPGPVTSKLQTEWSRLVGLDVVEQMMS
jgi:branched-subunit amino acid aminotransferase/4-amino-4-deoxychorismate lyase